MAKIDLFGHCIYIVKQDGPRRSSVVTFWQAFWYWIKNYRSICGAVEQYIINERSEALVPQDNAEYVEARRTHAHAHENWVRFMEGQKMIFEMQVDENLNMGPGFDEYIQSVMENWEKRNG